MKMSEEGKVSAGVVEGSICPMWNGPRTWNKCIQEGCAWWMGRAGACVMLEIGTKITEITWEIERNNG